MKKAKVEIQKDALAKALKYGMHFKRSTLVLIRKKHPNIDLFGINFFNIECHDVLDPNDRSVVVPIDEAEGDGGDKEDDSPLWMTQRILLVLIWQL